MFGNNNNEFTYDLQKETNQYQQQIYDNICDQYLKVISTSLPLSRMRFHSLISATPIREEEYKNHLPFNGTCLK